jgi:CRP-like cAMP-binding protein
MDVFAALKSNPLLRGFTDDGVRIIQSVVTVRTYDPGAAIFYARQPSDSALLLAAGVVSLFMQRDGGEQEVAVLEAPEAIGELALLFAGAHHITVAARTQVALLEIPRRAFGNLQKQRPQACMKLMLNIIERFGQKTADAAPLLERLGR